MNRAISGSNFILKRFRVCYIIIQYSSCDTRRGVLLQQSAKLHIDAPTQYTQHHYIITDHACMMCMMQPAG